jgi:hypothetical protein
MADDDPDDDEDDLDDALDDDEDADEAADFDDEADNDDGNELDFARVGPRSLGIDGWDLPRSENEVL